MTGLGLTTASVTMKTYLKAGILIVSSVTMRVTLGSAPMMSLAVVQGTGMALLALAQMSVSLSMSSRMGQTFAKSHLTFPVCRDSVMNSDLMAVQATVLVSPEPALQSTALRMNSVTMGVALVSLPVFAELMTSLLVEQQNETVTIQLVQASVGLVRNWMIDQELVEARQVPVQKSVDLGMSWRLDPVLTRVHRVLMLVDFLRS